MKLEHHVKTSTQGFFEALDAPPSKEQAQAVNAIIQEAVIKAALEILSTCVDVAKECCSANRYLTHKITGKIRLPTTP